MVVLSDIIVFGYAYVFDEMVWLLVWFGLVWKFESLKG